MSKNKNDVDHILEQIHELKRLFNKMNFKKINKNLNDAASDPRKQNYEKHFIERPDNRISGKDNININISDSRIQKPELYDEKITEQHIDEHHLNEPHINEKPHIHEYNLNEPHIDERHLNKNFFNERSVNNQDIKLGNVFENTNINNSNSRAQAILDNLENHVNLLVIENSRLREDKLKALADLENHKKMLNQEFIDYKKYSNMNFIKNLLPALDNFERALSLNNDNTSSEVNNFFVGFKFIYQNIRETLQKNGVVEISTKIGDEFNPHIHIGIETIETKKHKSGTIIEIKQKGYRLYDRVIRPVSVNVEK